MARTEVARWGNSLAVRLPREIAAEARLKKGTPVELRVEANHVVIRPARKRYTLKELLAKITKGNIPESFDDSPRGRELL